MMPRLEKPTPIGAIAAGKDMITVAAPLLTAAALTLSGIVASVEDKYFRWPGVTLLALVLASLLLIASIELHFHARQFLYSRAEMEEWLENEVIDGGLMYPVYCAWHDEDFKHGCRYKGWSVGCFNLGALFLGLGVAIALVPMADTRESGWRWGAFTLVLGGTILEACWVLYLYWHRYRLVKDRSEEAPSMIVREVPPSSSEENS
ncbi:hypothetical protein [Actinomadura gamaensis]|uniref:Uncharacterized protein n=1 Tax=Actinomadura gamaensis TaxID=1763541 RepID=A0ABV9TQ09_9ACTN